MSDIPVRLSASFETLAMATDAVSYKTVTAQILYRFPDTPHLLQEFTIQMHDKLDLNTEDVIIIMAALENPDLAPHLFQYLSSRRSADIPKEQLHHIGKKVSAKYADENPDDPASDKMIDDLKEKVTQALVRRFEFAAEVGSYKQPHGFMAHFDRMSTAAAMANIDMHPRTNVFKRLRAFLKTWSRDMDGPMHTVNVAVREVTGREELKEAVASVASGTSNLKVVSRRIIGAEDARLVTAGVTPRFH